MTIYQRPKPGDPIEFIERASLWRDVVDLLNEWKTGTLTSPQEVSIPRATVGVRNGSGDDVDWGGILQLSTLEVAGSGDADFRFQYAEAPLIHAIAPVWHTNIDRIVPVGAGVLDGQVFSYQRGWAFVKLNSKKENTDGWVMVDPSEPTKVKTADAGIWKILGIDANNLIAVVDTTENQPLWQYKLTEDIQTPPTTTTALLYRVDGTPFDAVEEIDLSDPQDLMSDQVTDDMGWCIHIGNTFQAIQAVC